MFKGLKDQTSLTPKFCYNTLNLHKISIICTSNMNSLTHIISSAKGVLNSVTDSGSAKNEKLVKFFSENSVQMISDVNVKWTQSKISKQDSTK